MLYQGDTDNLKRAALVVARSAFLLRCVLAVHSWASWVCLQTSVSSSVEWGHQLQPHPGMVWKIEGATSGENLVWFPARSRCHIIVGWLSDAVVVLCGGFAEPCLLEAPWCSRAKPRPRNQNPGCCEALCLHRSKDPWVRPL